MLTLKYIFLVLLISRIFCSHNYVAQNIYPPVLFQNMINEYSQDPCICFTVKTIFLVMLTLFLFAVIFSLVCKY